jgi:hypothetical protein
MFRKRQYIYIYYSSELAVNFLHISNIGQVQEKLELSLGTAQRKLFSSFRNKQYREIKPLIVFSREKPGVQSILLVETTVFTVQYI